jgi:hypothetical protein
LNYTPALGSSFDSNFVFGSFVALWIYVSICCYDKIPEINNLREERLISESSVHGWLAPWLLDQQKGMVRNGSQEAELGRGDQK